MSKDRLAREFDQPNTRLSDEGVVTIHREFVRFYAKTAKNTWRSNARELAGQFGISEQYVIHIINGHYRRAALERPRSGEQAIRVDAAGFNAAVSA